MVFLCQERKSCIIYILVKLQQKLPTLSLFTKDSNAKGSSRAPSQTKLLSSSPMACFQQLSHCHREERCFGLKCPQWSLSQVTSPQSLELQVGSLSPLCEEALLQEQLDLGAQEGAVDGVLTLAQVPQQCG